MNTILGVCILPAPFLLPSVAGHTLIFPATVQQPTLHGYYDISKALRGLEASTISRSNKQFARRTQVKSFRRICSVSSDIRRQRLVVA